MSTLERVTLDDLRYPARPERAPLSVRWAQVQEYTEQLVNAGEISPETETRILRVVGRWLMLELLYGRLGYPAQDFNRKVVRYLRRIKRKMS